MNDHVLRLRCSEPGCVRVEHIEVERSGVDARLAAIRSIGWDACTGTWLAFWCPAHVETRGVPDGAAPCEGC